MLLNCTSVTNNQGTEKNKNTSLGVKNRFPKKLSVSQSVQSHQNKKETLSGKVYNTVKNTEKNIVNKFTPSKTSSKKSNSIKTPIGI